MHGKQHYNGMPERNRPQTDIKEPHADIRSFAMHSSSRPAGRMLT